MTGRRSVDPEARRAERERGEEQDRKSFEDTGHVLYVLSAFARYRAGEAPPLWAHQRVLEIIREILPAFLDRPATPDRPKYTATLGSIREKVLDAFGLGKQQGRKLVAELRGQILDDVMATMLDCGIHADVLAKARNVESRQIKARARRARKRRPTKPS